MKSLFGNEINLDRVFIDKPKNLGMITNAYSNLFSNSPSTKSGLKLPLRLAAIFAGIALGYAIALFFRLKVDGRFFSMLGGGIVGLLSIKFNRTPKFYNVFIGTEGIAEYIIDNIKVEAEFVRGFQFEDALFMLSAKTSVFSNYSYQHTYFAYKWFDKNGKQIFKLSENYNMFVAPAKVENWPIYNGNVRYYFCHLAELKWTELLMQQTLKKIKENADSEIEFYIMSADWKTKEGQLLLNPGRLTIDFNNEKKVFRDEELKSVALGKGILKIIDTEYKWKLFHKEGNKIEIPISQISNNLFFIEIVGLWMNLRE